MKMGDKWIGSDREGENIKISFYNLQVMMVDNIHFTLPGYLRSVGLGCSQKQILTITKINEISHCCTKNHKKLFIT